jgi:hypothetical protein
MSQPSLGKNSAPLVLLHSRSPHLRQIDHASTIVSTFRNELHPLENFNTKLPAAPRKLLQRSAFSHKNFTKEKKTIRTSAFSTHTNLSHAHNTSALPTSIRPLHTNPCAPLSVYLTSCCAEKKSERDEDET